MHTLIFGAKGQLGRDITLLFSREGEVTGLDLPEVDIADAQVVLDAARQVRPDVIINAAAYTDVEGAEDNPDAAFRGNEGGARNVAEAAQILDVPVVYYSTDYVFDGEKISPYEPEDPIGPLSAYGQSKAAGEAATRLATSRHFIIRTAWLYGPGGNNFVEKILRAAQSRPSLKIVDDEVGSPTHTWDLAQATRALVDSTAYGTYHAVNAGVCSRYAFAKAFLGLAGMDTPVTPCTTAEMPTKATRPRYSVLSTEKLAKATGYRMRPWLEALEDYMNRRVTNS